MMTSKSASFEFDVRKFIRLAWHLFPRLGQLGAAHAPPLGLGRDDFRSTVLYTLARSDRVWAVDAAFLAVESVRNVYILDKIGNLIIPWELITLGIEAAKTVLHIEALQGYVLGTLGDTSSLSVQTQTFVFTLVTVLACLLDGVDDYVWAWGAFAIYACVQTCYITFMSEACHPDFPIYYLCWYMGTRALMLGPWI